MYNIYIYIITDTRNAIRKQITITRQKFHNEILVKATEDGFIELSSFTSLQLEPPPPPPPPPPPKTLYNFKKKKERKKEK